MSYQNEAKKAAADAALKYVVPGEILGIGTGSTVNYFIDALAAARPDIPAVVSSSEATTERLKTAGFEVVDLNNAGTLPVYVDGADEANKHLQLIKGGGGALTREKIVAAASRTFICIADDTKLVPILGQFPLPVEVIPMARSYVARELIRLGGQPRLREGLVTDNGNVILDVFNLEILDPPVLEANINLIAGVVCVGLFARRAADVLVVAGRSGVRELRCS